MKPYLFDGIYQYAFIKCFDTKSEIDGIKPNIDSNIPVGIVDCSGIVKGKDIRLLLNSAVKKIDTAERKVLLVYGIEEIDERELLIGLGDFCAFVDAYNDYIASKGSNISYTSYDYTFNPVGLSVFVFVRKDARDHFARYCEKYNFSVVDAYDL